MEILSVFTSNAVDLFIVPGLFAGVVLLGIGHFIPDLFAQYKVPAMLGGVALVLFFTFRLGSYTEANEYKMEKLEVQTEILKLQGKSKEINTETVIQYVDKIKYVDRIKEVPIDVYITKTDDKKCVIDPSTSDTIRMLINTSNQGKLPSATTTPFGSTK